MWVAASILLILGNVIELGYITYGECIATIKATIKIIKNFCVGKIFSKLFFRLSGPLIDPKKRKEKFFSLFSQLALNSAIAVL